jgi:hypothetical protein
MRSTLAEAVAHIQQDVLATVGGQKLCVDVHVGESAAADSGLAVSEKLPYVGGWRRMRR